jgi:hypothetical protein
MKSKDWKKKTLFSGTFGFVRVVGAARGVVKKEGSCGQKIDLVRTARS